MTVNDTHEPTLFDAEDDASRPIAVRTEAFADATDHVLDDHSWITHVHGFLSGHEELMNELSELDGWEQRRRWMYDREVDEPRLTHEYRDVTAAPPLLVEIADALSDYCGVHYDGIWMNWYRDHRDSTSWHADRPANQPATAVVPVVSLGAPRRFLIRPAAGGRSTAFTPLGGDVLIMRGRAQRDWRHCVPKQTRPAGARMSLNFSSTQQLG